MKKIKTLLLTLAIGLVSLLTYSQSKLEEAKTDYNNFKTIQAKDIYEQIWKTSALEDKITAGKQLVHINWKFYKDYKTSKKYSDSLLILSPDNFDILLQIANISIQADEFDNAEKYLNTSFNSAGNDNQKKESKIKYAEYVLEKSKKDLFNKKPININNVNKAFVLLKEYYINEPENLRLTRLYLGIALLSKKNSDILDAWRSYFSIAKNENATGLLLQAEENIKKGLKSNSQDNEINLVKGLSDSRFFDYAVMMMLQNNLDIEHNTDLTDVYNYYFFLNDIEALTYKYYREKTLGTSSDAEYLKNYYSLCIDFWYKLSWGNFKPIYFDEGFTDEIFKRFGAKILGWKGSNQISFTIGHSVIYNNSTSTQYGRKAKISYIALDNIVGNIYPHWYFGFFGVGGWATGNQIIQFRTVPLNNNSPLQAFNKLINEEEQGKWLAQIKEISIVDDSIARSNPYAILEGLKERLKYQGYSQILDSLKQLIHDNRALKISFISFTHDLYVDASVYRHEGRHLLDSYFDYPDNTKMFSSEEREFRAKLSEVTFSKYPKLIFAETMLRHEDPDHENASKRIIKGVVDWMEKNKMTIKNIKASEPLLPQMYLLSDEELVKALRSFDPLCQE